MGPAVITGYRWLAGVALLIACSTANAQSYPAKPVRYIVPFPAAASPDIIARLITEHFSRMWGQQVVVDNRAGAGGTLGAAYAAPNVPPAPARLSTTTCWPHMRLKRSVMRRAMMSGDAAAGNGTM